MQAQTEIAIMDPLRVCARSLAYMLWLLTLVFLYGSKNGCLWGECSWLIYLLLGPLSSNWAALSSLAMMVWAVILYFVIPWVWTGFVCLLDTKLETSERREPQLMKCLHEIHQWGIFSIINQWRMVQLIERGSIPVLVALGSIRREVEQVIWNKPVSSTPPGHLHQLLSPGFCPGWISF